MIFNLHARIQAECLYLPTNFHIICFMKRFIKYYISTYKGIPKNAWILSGIVLINRSGGMVLFFLSLYLTKEMGYSVATAGTMISIFGVGSLLGALAGGWLTDRIGANNVMLYSLFFSGFAFILLGMVTSLYLIGMMVFISALLSESFRPRERDSLCRCLSAGSTRPRLRSEQNSN